MKITSVIKLKKISALFMTAIVLLGQMALPQDNFRQVAAADEFVAGAGGDSSWAEPYLVNLFDRGIMRGDQDGNLDPNRDITRAEFVSMINRAFGYNQFSKVAKQPFKDITGKEWYADDIAIAFQEGYFAGNGKGTSGAEDDLTREQAVALLCRNLKIEGVGGENFTFKDSRTFNDWSRSAINAATEKGFISGYEDNTFRPSNNITRGESAKLFSDAVGELVSEQGDFTFGVINGNATVSTSGVTLRDTVITGDLYITGGVGTGFTNFENVRVLGEVIVSGTGEGNVGDTSIKFNNSTISKLTIDSSTDTPISLKIEGTTDVDKTIIKSNAYLEELTDREGGFRYVEENGPPKTQLYLAGTFDTVTQIGPQNELYLGRGEINTLNIDEDSEKSTTRLDAKTYVNRLNADVATTITGTGDIGYLNLNADGSKVDSLPDEIVIRAGVTGTVNGKKMTSLDAERASSGPKILSQYPKMDEIGPTTVTALLEGNKEGTIYWAVTLEDDDDLDEDELLKPKNVKVIIKSGTLAIKPDTEAKLNISGLKVDTEYTLIAMLKDNRDETSSIKRETFTTADNTKPAFISGYPKISAYNNSSVDISVIPTKNCKIYWAVYEKGNIAPTVLELKKQKVKGSLSDGLERGLKKNEETVFSVDGLEESTPYDLYMMATDGENDSALIKLSFTTTDKTPPKFLAGYPRSDKITDKTVAVQYNVDEDASIYYVVCKRGEEFPKPIPPETVSPALNSDAAKQAVLTANNAFKSGKASAKANNEGSMTISGLAPQTSYDLYVVAQDKAKNTSNVEKVFIKTADMIPPTVKLEYEEINGYALVDSDIKIVFSEEVWDATTLKSLSTVGNDMQKNITLYDLSAGKREEVSIDYPKVKVEIVEDQTVVTFSPEAVSLNSGNEYEFELNKITDTSSNKMSDKTILKFKTVAPLVELVKTVAPEDMDMTFQLHPQAIQTSDSVLFDIIFSTDTTVEFDLYEKDDAGDFQMITDDTYHPFVMENEAITLHYILDRKLDGQDDYSFERFNKLSMREYGIRFKSIDRVDERMSWSKTVKMNIKCVIGSKTNLSIVANNPKTGLDMAVQEGAFIVNIPEEFQLIASFTDMIIPDFMPGYPKLDDGSGDLDAFSQIGDVKALPLVRTNKKATFYYVIAPTGKIENPNPLDVMSGALKPNGGYCGKFDILDASSEFEVPMENLIPNTTYDVYFFLKGTPPETSDMRMLTFTTREMSPPELTANVTKRGEDFAEITITSTKDATVDWIVFPSLECPGSSDDPNSKEFIEIIRNGAETTEYKPTAFGSVKITLKKGASYGSAVIRISGLERNIYYSFFGVGKNDLGGGDSMIVRRDEITPDDVTPPDVKVTTLITGSALNANGIRFYNGSINLVFTEPIYYIKQENDSPHPMTEEAFGEGLYVFAGDDGDVWPEDPSIMSNRLRNPEAGNISITSATLKETREEDIKVLSAIKLRFTGVIRNSVVSYHYLICDKNKNVAGQLYLTFKDNVPEGEDPYWTLSWEKDY